MFFRPRCWTLNAHQELRFNECLSVKGANLSPRRWRDTVAKALQQKLHPDSAAKLSRPVTTTTTPPKQKPIGLARIKMASRMSPPMAAASGHAGSGGSEAAGKQKVHRRMSQPITAERTTIRRARSPSPRTWVWSRCLSSACSGPRRGPRTRIVHNPSPTGEWSRCP